MGNTAGPLLERDDALDRLAEVFEGVARSGALVAVAGDAGIGKTSLLRRFTASHRTVADVRWSACDPLATQRPLAPLVDIAAGANWLSLLDGVEGRARVFDALLRDLGSSARRSIVVVEDVHWADEATLDLLTFLRRRIATTTAMLVISYRDDELAPRHPLRDVIGDLVTRNSERIRLLPLSASAVTRLASGTAIDPAELHRVTGGNPFFVTETLAEPGQPVAQTVRDAVMTRARRLGAGARRTLEVVAVFPGSVDVALVERLADAGIDDLDACIERGILEVAGTTLSFRHELARRAWLDGLSPVRRQRLHLDALRALEGLGDGAADRARLAHHAIGAADPAAIVGHVPAAARQAAALGAHREAVRHYAAVAAHAERLDLPARAELFSAYAYECYLTDQLDTAIGAQAEVLALWRSAGDRRSEGDALRFLSRLAWFAGRNADAQRDAHAAIEVLAAFPGTTDLAMAYSNLAQLLMLDHDYDGAVHWGQRAIAIAEDVGDDEVLAHALNNVGSAHLLRGDPHGETMLERSLAIARSHRYLEHAARAYTNLGSSFVHARRYAEAASALGEGIAYCIGEDLDTWRTYMAAWRARERFETGHWDDGIAEASMLVERRGVAPVTLVGALVVVGRVRARRGDPEVWPVLDRALELAASTGEIQRLAPAVAARAEAAWLAGDPARGVAEIESTLALARARGDAWIVGELLLAARRAGLRVDDGADAAEPFRLHLAGRCAEAAAAWDALGCPYEAADCRGDAEDHDVVAAGLGALTAMGARPRERQVADHLRALGGRVPRGARVSTRSNVAGLTDREVEVARMLAVGLTDQAIADRLVISRKTAGHHVSHILTKLGVANRGEAAAIVARWPQDDATSN